MELWGLPRSTSSTTVHNVTISTSTEHYGHKRVNHPSLCSSSLHWGVSSGCWCQMKLTLNHLLVPRPELTRRKLLDKEAADMKDHIGGHRSVSCSPATKPTRTQRAINNQLVLFVINTWREGVKPQKEQALKVDSIQLLSAVKILFTSCL